MSRQQTPEKSPSRTWGAPCSNCVSEPGTSNSTSQRRRTIRSTAAAWAHTSCVGKARHNATSWSTPVALDTTLPRSQHQQHHHALVRDVQPQGWPLKVHWQGQRLTIHLKEAHKPLHLGGCVTQPARHLLPRPPATNTTTSGPAASPAPCPGTGAHGSTSTTRICTGHAGGRA